jgi:arsenate reductase (thioredoxin)
MTLRVLSEAGIGAAGLRSKNSDEFLGKVAVRWAVILCESANAACPHLYPFATHRLYWPFDDPAAGDMPEHERLVKFRDVRDQIAARIDAWLAEVGDPAAVVAR